MSGALQTLQKSIFCPTWPQLGPQDGPKLEPKWDQNRTKKGFESEVGSVAGFGTILDRFWTDFGPILGRFWADFGTILGPCLVDFWFILVAFGLLLVIVSHRAAIQTRA